MARIQRSHEMQLLTGNDAIYLKRNAAPPRQIDLQWKYATVLRNFWTAMHIYQRCNVLYYVGVDETRTPAI